MPLFQRYPAIVVGLISYGLGLGNQPETSALTADEIVERATRAQNEATLALEGYTSTREYVLSGSRFSKPAKITVRVTFNTKQGKSFEIISGDAQGMQRRILQRIMDGEAEASRQHSDEEMRLSPQNYSVRLLGSEQKNGIQCYVLALKPKRKSKFLLDGKAWVSSQDYGIVQIEGRPSERISFWVGKPAIKLSFRKFGHVWLMSSNRSVADVRLFGRSELSVVSSEMQVRTVEDDRASRIQNRNRRLD